jgi:dUTP pyrophosphatase
MLLPESNPSAEQRLHRLRETLSPEQRLQRMEYEIDAQHQLFGRIDSFGDLLNPNVFVFDGGRVPSPQSDEAVGYDAYARAIVDPLSKPSADNPLRRPIGDFVKEGKNWQNELDPTIRDWAVDDEADERKYAVNLPHGERLMIGLGIATGMNFPLYSWVAPRSGYASRGITVSNSPGTIDPDYRGEGGALIQNFSTDKSDFHISHNMRIVQLLFAVAVMPQFTIVDQHSELGETRRGAGGFGSTGKH